MAYAYEHAESPVYNDDGSLERTFIVHGTIDAEQADGVVANAASPIFEGRFRHNIPAYRQIGPDTLEAKVKYTVPPADEDQEPPPNNDPPGGVLEFDTSGGTTHVTTAPVFQYKSDGAPDMKHAIGVTKDGVEGCDIVVPKLSLSATKKFAIGAINGNYVKNLARLTGCTNQSPYTVAGAPFDSLELLFLGATGSCIGRPYWEINYRFEASENIYDGNIAGIQYYKGGHDYLWALFKPAVSGEFKVQVPAHLYTAVVYKAADFYSVLGF